MKSNLWILVLLAAAIQAHFVFDVQRDKVSADFETDLSSETSQWTVRCTTAEEAPIEPAALWSTAKMQVYQKLLDNQSKGMCEKYIEPIPATVPGEIHQDLRRAGILEHDPLYRLESITQNWVTLQQQTYET